MGNLQLHTGVIIGRFQVPQLTQAHTFLLDHVREQASQVIVLLGVRPATASQRNPLPFTVRAHMIREAYPKVMVLPLMDARDDFTWTAEVDKTIRAVCGMGPAVLYGGRDSIQEHYHGKYPMVTVDFPDHMARVSGTVARQSINHESVPSFRSGVIWGLNQRPPRLDMAVDMMVVHPNGTDVLLGKKHGENLYRLPGGMFDPGRDRNFRDAASRELREETALGIHPHDWTYVGDFNVDDWRCRGIDDHFFHTMLFVATPSNVTTVRGSDDLTWAGWIPLEHLRPSQVVSEHVHLIHAASDYLG